MKHLEDDKHTGLDYIRKMGGWAGGRERQTDREPDLGRDKRLERERSSKVKHDSHITNTLSNQQS